MTTVTPVSIVSGAASGIGRRMAVALVRAGHRVVLTDVNAVGLERLRSEERWADTADVVLHPFDARDSDAWGGVVEFTAQRFLRVDYMFNIAGTLTPGYVTEIDAASIHRQVDVNVKALMFATCAGARQMARQGHGHILNVASIAGISHVPGLSVYCATKHAVRGFSLSVAHELAPRGVAVTVFCPDAVETPMLTLQEGAPEAAMVFAAGRALSLDEVEAALFRAMRTRPLEVVRDVPRSGRAIAAKLANAFPRLTGLAVKHVVRQGLAAQAKRKAHG
jgi:3-oxoacyl-[acyl-carrier protein] reductase